MSGKGNGKPIHFRLDMSGQVVGQIKELVRQATEKGNRQSVKKALVEIVRRLREAPWDFGELIREYKQLKLSEHVAFVKPLRVRFAIHREMSFVILMKIELVEP